MFDDLNVRMRLTILLLILAVSAQAGLLEKAKGFFKGGNLIDRIKNATLTRFGKIFVKTGLFSFGSKLNQIRKKTMNKLKLTWQKKKVELESKMKEILARRDNTIEDLKDTIVEINAASNIGKLLFQSDILLTKKQADEVLEAVDGTSGRKKRQAFKDKNYPNTTWLGAQVFYKFDDSADHFTREMFKKGAKQWEDVSCIKFHHDKENKSEHSIVLIKEEGCWSYVGRLGGEQPLSLGVGCEEEDFVDQYIKETTETTTNYDLTYDYASIMHYGATGASHNKKPTMIANDVNFQESMGSHILTFIDKSMINDHYNCKAKCLNAKSHQCKNGGFPHPEKCSECICPSGYGGAFCNERPSGCGRKLVAKQSKQFLIDKLGFGGPVRDEFTFCNYWIEAPEGKTIEVKINSISHGYAYDGCILGGVEIKSNQDQTRTGYRFCSPNDRNVKLVSASNRLPVITFNRLGQQQVILEYKIAE
ncbi:hypothetical protein V3C99_006147 [Haemonchus contortus]|uniref:Zinc metalloproteinase n=1 Tax=Haemonchus contortus TaxID=6289 RepID=A0A7I4XTG5_HAECO